ncbi:MAG: pyrroline-5-carboxylate reductase [Saprospiraceae bacterium]|nr:pyrroline-5-carboxylate reductase [Saprospiraceae bacterium]MCB9318250.1 pyrroline-5-carboxylate reductase [Lewinellaceae bacterium]
MKILIVGGGNMGLTYARAFLRSHLCSEEDLMILEKSERKRGELASMKVGHIHLEPDTCLPFADLIILAVKPQDTSDLFSQLQPHLDSEQVVLSIMAGIPIAGISHALGVQKIIRAMPNLPAQIGMGMTVFTSAPAITRIELVTVQNLLNTTGKSIYVENESMIDAATAISGSGPAYVFYFMRSMMESAASMGFSTSESELLVSQTFLGAIELYMKSDFSCAEWIQKVASRGGTTEAALASFTEHTVNTHIGIGLEEARLRAEALGKSS